MGTKLDGMTSLDATVLVALTSCRSFFTEVIDCGAVTLPNSSDHYIFFVQYLGPLLSYL